MACKYKLNLNGKIFEFNSEEELDSFINNNHHRLSLTKGDSTIKFSKNFNPKEEAIAKIKKAIQDSIQMTTSFDENGERVLHVAPGYIGVTRKIDEMKDPSGKRITKEFILDEFKKNSKESYREKVLKNANNHNLADNIIDELAEQLMETDLRNWAMLGPMGTDIHAMAELFFTQGIESAEVMLEKINKPFTLPTMEKYIGILKQIKDRIISDTGEADVTILSEVKIHDPNSKVAGILDIVAIDSKGHAHIYDFKTSYKKIEDWNMAKNNKMFYQQGFYKQLLNTAGVIVSPNAGINIIPIELIDIDYDNKIVSDIQLQETERLEPQFSSRPYIMENIKKVIPTSINSTLNIEVQSEKVKKELKDAFGYEVKAGYIYGKQNFIRDRVREDDNHNKYFEYRQERVYLTGDADKDDEIITAQLKSEAEAKNADLNILKSSIKRVIKEQSDLNIDLTGRLGGRYSVAKWNFAATIFKPYVDGTWEVIDSPDLDSLGIIGFNNVLTNTLEFVSLTGNSLTTPIKLAKGTSILGNYVDDRTVQKDANLLKSTGANIEAFKVAMFLNDNVDAFKAVAADVNLGNIRIVNINNRTVEGINKEDLFYSYEKLNVYTNVQNNLNKLPKANPYNTLLAQLNRIIESEDTPTAVKTRMGNLKTRFTPDPDSSILTQLYDAQRTFIVDQRKNLDTVDAYGSDEEQIFRLINESINYFNGVTIRIEKDLVDWGVSNSRQTSSINDVSNSAIKEVNRLVKSTMSNIRVRYDDYKSDTRGSFEELFEAKGLTTFRRYTIGDNITAYDNLFVRDVNGSISKEMKVKDPANMSNDLTPAERKFLNVFLKRINDERYKYAEQSEVQEAKATGDWFNIPLVKAGSLSRFRNKDYKSIVKDYWDDILNFNNLFTEDEGQQAAKSNEMLEMYNHMALSPEARKARIDNHGIGDFETDLEVVLDLYVMGSIRKEEFDQVLPAVMAVKLETQYMNAGLLDRQVPNTIGYIDEFIKIAVYNEPLIDDNQKKLVKGIKVLTKAVSQANLGFNFLSGMREVLQGQWANSVRLFSRTYGENQYTRADYGKALKYMLNESPDFIKNVTVIEAINGIYGIANMDLNSLPDRMSISDTGMTAFFSKWTMWMNSAPDYLNRMSIFIAQMMHDGCFEAHTMVNDKLVYDWKKDKRFSAYANGNKNDPNYKAQEGLYLGMMQDFILEGARNKDGSLVKMGDPLPRAYTAKEGVSLKSFSDSIHGHYDHEAKTKSQRTWFGLLFGQFKTWLIAKKDQWTREGGYYSQGSYKHLTNAAGQKLYRTIDAEGKPISTTDETGTPIMAWQGNWQEGILVSLSKIMSELKEAQYDVKKAYAILKDDGAVTSNLRLMAGDLSIFIGLALIAGLIDWDKLREDDAFTAAIARAVLSSGNDLFIGNNISALVNPKSFIPSLGYVYQVNQDLWGVISGDRDMYKAVTRNVGLLRPLQYVQVD